MGCLDWDIEGEKKLVSRAGCLQAGLRCLTGSPSTSIQDVDPSALRSVLN